MKISIITPFYDGNKFIERLFSSVKKAILHSELNMSEIEFIIVNDSPWISVEMTNDSLFDLIIINNNKNIGVHGSRVVGLKKAKGDFILFLDQDDEITPDSLKSQYSVIENNDIVIGNGEFIFDKLETRKIYSTENYLKQTIFEENYLKVRDLIVSPGHCLIRKESIPTYWKENIMDVNGADDFLLWLLMFNEKRKFVINNTIVYKHHDSGVNISFDLKQMENSKENLISALSDNKDYSSKKIKLLERCFLYKNKMYDSKIIFIIYSFFNLDLFFYNIIFRKKYGKGVLSYKEMKIIK